MGDAAFFRKKSRQDSGNERVSYFSELFGNCGTCHCGSPFMSLPGQKSACVFFLP